MKGSMRFRFGLWLERFRWLHPVLGRYSHEYPEGRHHYVNRVSGTFLNLRATVAESVCVVPDCGVLSCTWPLCRRAPEPHVTGREDER